MRFPFVTELIRARSDAANAQKEANSIARDRIELEREHLKVRTEAMKSVLAMTKIDQSLSAELYGNGSSQYKIGSWSLPIAQMRRMSRIAYWDSSFARSIIDRWVQIVVGKGLTLESQPAWGMIAGFFDREKRQEKIDDIETRWKVWAKSKKVHYLQEFNIARLVSQAFFYFLYDGEFFAIFRYAGTGRGRNPLTIELIAPENIKATTSEALGNNEIDEGIEYDLRGVAVAYHIFSEKTGDSMRVPKFGARSGRQFVYHNYNKKNERQRRGVPLLTGEISEITQLADYQNLEIQAAKVNALFAIWIEPPEHSDGQETIGSGARKKGVVGVDTQTGEQYTSKLEEMSVSDGGIIIDKLPAGHKPHSFDTKRPNVSFEKFTNPVKRNISSGAGMALSVADYNFAQQYSSARGELIVLYYKVMDYRENVAADFQDAIYGMWLWGEVDAGKLVLPGFGDEETRDAWNQAFQRGESRPDIDPKKSMEAHKMEMAEGIKSRQQVASERDGGNASENIARLQTENDSLAAAVTNKTRIEQTNYSVSETNTVSDSTTRTKGVGT